MSNQNTVEKYKETTSSYDLRKPENIELLGSVLNWINHPQIDSAQPNIEVVCPHAEMRNFIGQRALDVNHQHKKLYYQVHLIHTKTLSSNVTESFMVVINKLKQITATPVVNRKTRRTKPKTKKRR